MNKNYFDDHIDTSNELVQLAETKIIIAQQGAKLPLYQEYFGGLLKSGANLVKTIGKGIQQQHANQAEALAVPGNAANWAMQKGMQALAKKTHGLTDDDMPTVGFESPSSTINRNFKQFDPLNFGQSLGVDILLDPTTYVSGKAASKMIKNQLGDRTLKQVATEVADAVKNAKVIPTRKRILPKKFEVSSREFKSPFKDQPEPKFETILHDAKNPKHEYGSISTIEKQAKKGVGPHEIIPEAIDVDPTVQGNRVQDMLYQEHLNYLKNNTSHDYIRTGDFLLSPEHTQKFWNRSIVEDIPGAIVENRSLYDYNTKIPMNVKRYRGSQNPNVTSEVLARISKLPKHEFKFKSYNEIQAAKSKGKFLNNVDFGPMKDASTDVEKLTPNGWDSAYKQVNPTFDEAITYGEDKMRQFFFGRKDPKLALDNASKWMDDWMNHPETQKRIANSLEGFKREYPQYVENNIRYFRDYRPKAEFYPIKQQFKDIWNTATKKNDPGVMSEHIHDGNHGVNYNHFDLPTDVVRGSTKPHFPTRTKSYVSRVIDDAHKETVGVHELTHDIFKDQFLRNSGQSDIINRIIPLEIKKTDDKMLKYLQKPTEVQARIMQLRHMYNLKPGQQVTTEIANNIINDVSPKAQSRLYGHKVLRTIQNDPERLKQLMNNLFKATAVGTGAATIASQQND